MTDQPSFHHAFAGRAWVCRDEGLPSAEAADLISDKENRWNTEGEPTLYLSGDPALAFVECARHPDDLKGRARLLEVEVRIPRVVDLRDPDVRGSLSLSDDLEWVLDRGRTRKLARSLRRSGRCDALIVPSAGALDQDDRFNLVVFAEDRDRIRALVGGLRPVGELDLRPVSAGG
jgi:RES domain-containing protein